MGSPKGSSAYNKMLKRANERYKKDPEFRAKLIEYGKRFNRNLRQEMLDNYGRICVCCGETHEEFLTLDHLDPKVGGRVKFGKYTKNSRGLGEYLRLRRLGWPKEGLRILCMNCNFAIGKAGFCPHSKL